MNKLQNIVNNKWFAYVFFIGALAISIFQHYRVFSLDVIGYHSWRQTQTQTVINNFVNVDFNILNPRLDDLHYVNGIYRMEFPLAQWLVACLYKLFGNHLYLTRLFFYMTTWVSVFGMFQLVFVITKDKLTSLLTAWLFLFSPVIYYYSVNPLPDNLALCFGIWSVYFWIHYLRVGKPSSFIWSCIFFSLSVAVKLPFIVFGAMYVSKFIEKKGNRVLNFKYAYIPIMILIPSLLWYLWVIPSWVGNGIVKGVFDNDKTYIQLLDILQFNLISTFPELLINYATVPLFLIGLYVAIKRLDKKVNSHRSFIYVGVLLVVYFLYELPMIDKVHDYYLFPFLPWLFVIVALSIHYIISMPSSKLKYLIVVSVLLSPITSYLRCNTRWNTESPGFTKEYLSHKHQIQAMIPKTAKVMVIGDDSRSIVLYHLKRQGWSIGQYGIKDKDFEDGIKNGATFIISDCDMATNALFIRHTDSLLFKINNIKLYKLK